MPSCLDDCFGLYTENGQIVGFIAVAKTLFGNNRHNHYTVSRLVVLPDYQGVGLGTKFLEFVARAYRNDRKLLDITTSAKNLIIALNKKSWAKMVRFGKTAPDKRLKKRVVNTASFKFDFKDEQCQSNS